MIFALFLLFPTSLYCQVDAPSDCETVLDSEELRLKAALSVTPIDIAISVSSRLKDEFKEEDLKSIIETGNVVKVLDDGRFFLKGYDTRGKFIRLILATKVDKTFRVIAHKDIDEGASGVRIKSIPGLGIPRPNSSDMRREVTALVKTKVKEDDFQISSHALSYKERGYSADDIKEALETGRAVWSEGPDKYGANRFRWYGYTSHQKAIRLIIAIDEKLVVVSASPANWSNLEYYFRPDYSPIGWTEFQFKKDGSFRRRRD